MIRELVELSQTIKRRYPNDLLEQDALDKVPVSIECIIDKQGNFKNFVVHDKQLTIAEKITAKKGKARLLVDKPEEVLACGERAQSKHELFMRKLESYKHLKQLSPVFKFYGANTANGIKKAKAAFFSQVEEKDRNGNIAFLVGGKRLNEEEAIQDEIISHYEVVMKEIRNSRFDKCSVCGSDSYPIVDLPHGMVKRVPDGQTSGCALVSYNDRAYESYGLKGNENSSICSHCAQAYVASLNWLLSNGSNVKNDKGKEVYAYRNRRNISEDTAVVFWLRDALETSELDLLDEPDEGKIRQMFRAIESGRASTTRNLATDEFYAITLSGSAARIAVRDWIETSVENLHADISHWFLDIEIGRYDVDEKKIIRRFPRFWELVRAVKGKGGKDALHGRIGSALWKCAVLGASTPLWVLSATLSRIRAEQGNATAERIALLKLILNRNQKGGLKFMAELDVSNRDTAYTCGRIFAVLESIQYHASGGNLNAGVRERFFSFASAMPATAFGRLMKLTQHHISKISGEKPGLAVNLDKKLQELISRIEGSRFPAVFSLEEQASFAIGYYHQRQNDFNNKSDKEN